MVLVLCLYTKQKWIIYIFWIQWGKKKKKNCLVKVLRLSGKVEIIGMIDIWSILFGPKCNKWTVSALHKTPNIRLKTCYSCTLLYRVSLPCIIMCIHACIIGRFRFFIFLVFSFCVCMCFSVSHRIFFLMILFFFGNVLFLYLDCKIHEDLKIWHSVCIMNNKSFSWTIT